MERFLLLTRTDFFVVVWDATVLPFLLGVESLQSFIKQLAVNCFERVIDIATIEWCAFGGRYCLRGKLSYCG